MGQFGTLDTRDDRRELMILLQKLGTNEKRARFLKGLIPHSVSMASANIRVDPVQCTTVGAYWLLVSITGVLGVPMDNAARMLEQEVKRQ